MLKNDNVKQQILLSVIVKNSIFWISPVHPTTYTHTRLTALFPGLPTWAGTSKVKPIWILQKQETVSGSAIRKSAPCSRQITTPAPHHCFFTGRIPFLPRNQQRQSTESISHNNQNFVGWMPLCYTDYSTRAFLKQKASWELARNILGWHQQCPTVEVSSCQSHVVWEYRTGWKHRGTELESHSAQSAAENTCMHFANRQLFQANSLIMTQQLWFKQSIQMV